MSSNQIIVFLWAIVGTSFAVTVAELFAAWCHLKRRRPFRTAPAEESGLRRGDSDAARITILKPLCGAEDGLEENLRTFALLDSSCEVICSIADPADPAVEIVRRVMQQHPDSRLQLVIGDRDRSIANPKVERLIAAYRRASGDIIMISDAQVRLRKEDLDRAVDVLRDRAVGCVSHLFTGAGARNVGALVESTHLLSFVLAGNALAGLVKVPCLVGKSMAMPRAALERIGGFAAFADVLAEDQAIAMALRKNGYRLALAPSTVSNYVERKTVAASIDRQVRWNKIRYSFSRATYASEFLVAPGALAIIAAALTAAMGRVEIALVAATCAFVLRFLQVASLARLTGADRSNSVALLAPVQDLLQFAAWFVPFFSDRVNWRGTRARLARGTVIVPLEPRVA